MNYLKHLRSLESLLLVEKLRRQKELIGTAPGSECTAPGSEWPAGMPASIDPKLVLVGVSYGNSANREAEEAREEARRTGGDYFYSDPCVIKPDNSHFYYPDRTRYWDKLRCLSESFFKRH